MASTLTPGAFGMKTTVPARFGFGIPHPGLVWISADGVILAKWALRGYKNRADWKEVLDELAVAISAKSETR